MAIQDASIDDLHTALLYSSVPKTILVGAAISSVAPSCLPDGRTWVLGLIRQLLEVSGLSLTHGIDSLLAIDKETGRLPIPLEAALSAIEASTQGLGTSIVSAIATGAPTNSLHELIVSFLISGNTRVMTTNFDLLLEDAYSARTLGRQCRRWIAGDHFDAEAEIFKLRGSADRPESLRHTFRAVNRRAPKDAIDGVRALSSDRLIVAGYAGADFDITDLLLSDGTDPTSSDGIKAPVYWLEVPGKDPPAAAVLLAATRDLHFVAGTFADLLQREGLSGGSYEPDGRHVWGRMNDIIRGIPPATAREILMPLLYQSRVAEPATSGLFIDFRAALRASPDPQSRRLFHLAEASDAQHKAGFARNHLRAAWHFARFARPGKWAASASDIMDSVQRIAHGAFVPGRIAAIPFHWIASRVASGAERARMRMRLATSLSIFGLHRVILKVLDHALEDDEADTYTEGLILKRRAMAAAAMGGKDWEADILEARKRFLFENRTVELGVLLRAEGHCALLQRDYDRALSLTREAEAFQRRHGQHSQEIESRMLSAVIQFAPWLARVFVRFV
jgi:hypothetical protein